MGDPTSRKIGGGGVLSDEHHHRAVRSVCVFGVKSKSILRPELSEATGVASRVVAYAISAISWEAFIPGFDAGINPDAGRRDRFAHVHFTSWR